MSFSEFFQENIIFFIIAIFIFGLLMIIEVKSAKYKDKILTPSVLTQKINSGAVLIDLRKEGDYKAGHIVGAKNIPIDQLENKLSEIGKKDKSVILYCYRGMSSEKSISVLEKAGFTSVFHLGQGIEAWRKDDMPLSKS